MATIRWVIDDRQADLRALVLRLAQARSEKVQQSRAIAKRDAVEQRRVREEDLHLKRVGAAIRRAIREQVRRQADLIQVFAPPLVNGRSSPVRCRGLETMARLRVPRPSHVGSDGLSSFHFRWTGRGLGERRRKRSHRYRAGEAVRHLRYICRALAREIEDGGLVSNISRDPEHVAGFFAALEELEHQSVGDSNVYVSLVVALPHELSSTEREALLEQICSVPAGEGLPYVGVLHAPDPNGDRRNYHAHIMLSLRPAEILADGHYAFHVQKRSELNDGEFIAGWRAQTAELMNAAMERGGHKRRFTPLSNAERGMAPQPKGSGKSSPGAKHRERRAEQLDHFTAERAWRGELGSALQRVRGVVTTLVDGPSLDYSALFAGAVERMRSSLIARRIQILDERQTRERTLAAARTELADKILTGNGRLKGLAARLEEARGQSTARVARAQPPRVIDPEKTKAVARAIAALAGRRFLPLQKIGDRFELTKTFFVSDEACRRIDCFDAEVEVQTFFREKWHDMLAALRLTIEQAKKMPFIPGPGGYVVDPKQVNDELYAAARAAGNAPEVQRLLSAGLEYWAERQRREEQRKAKTAKEAAARQAKLAALIREVDAAGPGGRPWSSEQQDTVVVPFRILVRAAADGRVLIRRDGAGLTMATTEPHLQNFAEMLDGTAEGRWALGRLADGGGSDVVAATSWTAFWSSGTRSSPIDNDRDEVGRHGFSANRGGSERE